MRVEHRNRFVGALGVIGVRAGLSCLAGLSFLGGCVEERVVYNRPMLGGLPGSTTAMPVTPPAGLKQASESGTPAPIKIDNPDGTVTLRARTGRHLMIHIHNLLDDKPVAKQPAVETPEPKVGETTTVAAPPKAGDRENRPVFETRSAAVKGVPTNEEIFSEQVLSEMTRSEFIERGLPVSEAYRILKEARDDIEDLFAMMHMGEATPGVFLDKVGDKVYRMRVPAQAARDLRFTGMDMVMEKGNWKLRWFVEK